MKFQGFSGIVAIWQHDVAAFAVPPSSLHLADDWPTSVEVHTVPAALSRVLPGR